MLLFKKEVNNDIFVYQEGIISGKRCLSINDKDCEQIKNNTFKHPDEDKTYKIKGDYVRGISLVSSNGEKIGIVSNKWYEYITILFPLILAVFGVMGGIVGGALAGMLIAINIFSNAVIIRAHIKVIIKIILLLVLFMGIAVLWFCLFALTAGGIQQALDSFLL